MLEKLKTEIEEILGAIKEGEEILSQTTKDSTRKNLMLVLEGLQHMVANKIHCDVVDLRMEGIFDQEIEEYFVGVLSGILDKSNKYSSELFASTAGAMLVVNTAPESLSRMIITENKKVMDRKVPFKPGELVAQEKELDLSLVKLANNHYMEKLVMEGKV